MFLAQKVLCNCIQIRSSCKLMKINARSIHVSRARMSFFEPDDVLDQPDVPQYENLQIRMRGYDFPILESYAKYVHRLAQNLEQETESIAVPGKKLKVQSMKTTGNKVQNEYDLTTFERIVEVDGLPSTMAPILFEVIQANLPQGVWFKVKEPTEEEDDFRFVPDIVLMDLRAKVDEIDQAKEDRKKK